MNAVSTVLAALCITSPLSLPSFGQHSEISRTLASGGGVSSNTNFRAFHVYSQTSTVGACDKFQTAHAPAWLNRVGFLSGDETAPGYTDNTDGDGLRDWAELCGSGISPPTPSSTVMADTDLDHQSDGDEYVAGTNPQDSSSRFEIIFIEFDGEAVVYGWHSRANRLYAVHSLRDINEGLPSSDSYRVRAAPDGNGEWKSSVTVITNALPEPTMVFGVEAPRGR